MEEKIRDGKVNAETGTESQLVQEAKRKAIDPREFIRKNSKGKLMLFIPIRAGGRDVEELEYDFSKLTGLEMAEAMDSDTSAGISYRTTNKQALHLFATAAGKATQGVDSTDILERLSGIDTVPAIQLAMAFFMASSQAGNMRITTE